MSWKPSWLQPKDGENKEGDKNDLPPELDQRFKDLNEQTKKDVTSILDERLKGLDDIVAFAKEAKDEKEKKSKKPDPKPDPNANKTAEELNAEFVARFAENPLAALKEAMSPAEQAILLTRADNVKREVFVDRAEEFPYYSGEIKKEIDKILEGQDLRFRNNSQSVENVYFTVVGKHQAEIQEGKIKTRFASATQSTSSGKGAGEEEKKPLVMTEEMKKAAKLMGFSEEDYKKILEKEEEVNV